MDSTPHCSHRGTEIHETYPLTKKRCSVAFGEGLKVSPRCHETLMRLSAKQMSPCRVSKRHHGLMFRSDNVQLVLRHVIVFQCPLRQEGLQTFGNFHKSWAVQQNWRFTLAVRWFQQNDSKMSHRLHRLFQKSLQKSCPIDGKFLNSSWRFHEPVFSATSLQEILHQLLPQFCNMLAAKNIETETIIPLHGFKVPNFTTAYFLEDCRMHEEKY